MQNCIKRISFLYSIDQSICTHYSCFENLGGFVTLKKIRSKVFDQNKIRSKVWTWKKQGAKKQSHCYSKREEARLPFLFLNKTTLFFCTLLFSGPYFGPDFFSGSQTDPCFQNKNSGCRLTGRLGFIAIDCLVIYRAKRFIFCVFRELWYR